MPGRGGRGGRGGGRGGRGGSGPWGRLRLPEQDPLESIGLPSKGDASLHDPKAQEKYYTKIVERYMTICSDAGQRDELLRRFSSVESKTVKEPPGTNRLVENSQTRSNTKDLTVVMMALRKLREGIVASKRADEFAVQAYLFCIRLSILVKQHEAYHPAILHLLRVIHPQHPLTSVELQDVVCYLVLDTACRRGDLAEAYAIRQRYGVRDARLNLALAALAHDNYVVFERVRRAVEGHRARLMEWAQANMKTHTLKCFGRTYLTVNRGFLERTVGSTWDELTQNDGVGWELDGDTVNIRKPRAR